MICEHCHQRQASIIITEMHNNSKIQRHVCPVCAKKSQEKAYNHDSFQQFLTGLLKLQGNDIKELNNSNMTCPKCGCTLDEFRKTSKLGCETCYEMFSPYIGQLIKRVQSGTTHTGKLPKRLNKVEMLSEKIEELEQKLKLALMQEDYHEAARLRDKLLKYKEDNDE